jgi:hypothetical protein
LGSEPEIYFIPAAFGDGYINGLMEPQKYAHQMQQEMITDRTRVSVYCSVAIFYSCCGVPDRSVDLAAMNGAKLCRSRSGYDAYRTDYFFGDVPPSVER